MCHLGQLAPGEAGSQSRPDNAARTGAGHHRGVNSKLAERLDHTDVRQSPHRAAAQSQPDRTGSKRIKKRHGRPLYRYEGQAIVSEEEIRQRQHLA